METSKNEKCKKSLPGVDSYGKPNEDLKFKANKNSFNSKDQEGEYLFNLLTASASFLVVFVILLFFVVFLRKKSTTFICLLVFVIISLVVIITVTSIVGVHIKNNPISLLYAGNQLMTKNKRTPPIMQFETPTEKKIASDLEKNYFKIKKNVYDLVANHQLRLVKNTYSGQNEYIGSDTTRECEGCEETGWRIFTVNIGDNFTQQASEYLPDLVEVLKKYPCDIVSCAVSIIPPKTKIPPHVGYSSFVKRLMLAIEVPEDADNCYLCVNGEKLTWENGKTILWDDTFCHAVYNETDQRRIVIYMDVRRYANNKFIDWLGDKMIKIIGNSEYVKKEIRDTEKKVKIET